MDAAAIFRSFIERYRGDPVAFVEDILGAKPDPWQARVLAKIAKGVRRISIRSGHGTGKSTLCSWAAIWYLITRFPVKIVCTAPSSSTLFDGLLAEMKAWVNKLPPELSGLLEYNQDSVRLSAAPDEAFISARTSRADTPEALAGVHSDHVMLIVDEASGVPEQVYEAASGSMSGDDAVALLIGNPTRNTGYFARSQTALRAQQDPPPPGYWHCEHISCLDTPRVSAAYVAEQRLTYGENSNAYRVRVLGEFPLAEDDTVIAYETIAAAMGRDIAVLESAPRVWGLDVARFGSDKTVLVERHGNIVPAPPERWSGLDTMQVTGLVAERWNARPDPQRPAEILVDSIGIGAGVVDRLRELGLPAIGINVSESPSIGNKYLNLRAQLWFSAKDWLATLAVRLPKDETLAAELAAPRYAFSSSGRLQVESKQDMKKRGVPSPDGGDALALTFGGTAAVAAFGRPWAAGRPLKRGIKGLV